MTVLFIIAAVVAGMQSALHALNVAIALSEDDDSLGQRSVIGFIWSTFFLVMFILAAVHV